MANWDDGFDINVDYTKNRKTASQPQTQTRNLNELSGDYTANARPRQQVQPVQQQSQKRQTAAQPARQQKKAAPRTAAGGSGNGNGGNNNNIKKNTGKKPPKKKKNRFLTKRRPGIWSGLLTIAVFIAFAFAVYELVKIDLFPFYLILAAAVAALAITLLIVVLWWAKARRPVFRTLCFVLVGALTIVYVVGGNYLIKTSQVFTNITALTDKTVHTTSLITLKTTGYDSISDLKNGTIGTVTANDAEGMNKAVTELSEQISFTTQDYEGVLTEVSALYNGEVDAILFPESARDVVHETDGYFEFNTDTDTLTQIVYYTDKSDTGENEPDDVKNITKNSFTILISGNDSYGDLSENSRSDVNMLVTINPQTHVVLMTSIPRDSYVTMSCKKNESACSAGEEDKLTHTGLYGIATTESTIEDFLDVEINYTIQVNFSSLVNLVDALGGIDVYVEEGLEVETFYANGTEGVSAGWNHLEGERALAFARERHAYRDGDNQRVKNQQIVMAALINKVISPEIIFRYPALMDAVGVAFETNMPADQIKEFIRYEIMNMPDWQIISYAIAGNSDLAYCASLGGYASVTVPAESMVSAAKTLIDMVENGDSAEDISTYAAANSLDSAGSYSTEEQIAERNAAIGVYDETEDYGTESWYYSDDTNGYEYSEDDWGMDSSDYDDSYYDPYAVTDYTYDTYY